MLDSILDCQAISDEIAVVGEMELYTEKKKTGDSALEGRTAGPASQDGQIRWMDEKMHEFKLVGRQYVRANFWDMQEFLTASGVLETIAANPKKWLPLHKIVNHLDSGCRFAFWQMVFENRDRIPREELRRVWYDCLMDGGCRNFQLVITKLGREYFTNVIDPEMQSASVITDPLLIDDPIVSHRYCQVRKNGWRLLQYIHGRRHQTLKMQNGMRQAIHQDDVPGFFLRLTMARMNVSFSMLAEVLEHRAAGIFRYLLENRMFSDDVISLEELCCYLTAWFKDDVSVPLLNVIEEWKPGFLRGVKDGFGRNLLWYAVQNMKTGWFHPDCRLTPFLLEHGCDPQNENQIGLTWQEVMDGIPAELMERMMQRRYNMEHYSATSPKLQLTQPLHFLKK